MANFNPAQLATYTQARVLAADWNKTPVNGALIGGGVRAEIDNPVLSGIYIPSWLAGPSGFPIPGDPDNDTFFLHFRLVNGADGINVGLVLDRFARYPMSPTYVWGQLAAEIASMSAT